MNKEALKYFCKDCEKKIGWLSALYGGGRCRSCSAKKQFKEKGHPCFIDGRSKKKYYCKACGKEICISSGLYGQGRCCSCSIKGRHHTEETKQKMRDNHVDVSGKKNPNYKNGIKNRKVYCIDCGKTLKNNYAKRCVMCNGLNRRGKKIDKDKIKTRGKKNGMFGRITHGRWEKYKGIWMRSSWEIAFAFFLDCSRIKREYEPKVFDLGDTTYTPDFYLPEFDCYIEIKGYWREDAKKKFSLFKEKYPEINIRIFDKNNLLKYGIIE